MFNIWICLDLLDFEQVLNNTVISHFREPNTHFIKSISLRCLRMFANMCLNSLWNSSLRMSNRSTPIFLPIRFIKLRLPLETILSNKIPHDFGFLLLALFKVEQTSSSKWRTGSKFLLEQCTWLLFRTRLWSGVFRFPANGVLSSCSMGSCGLLSSEEYPLSSWNLPLSNAYVLLTGPQDIWWFSLLCMGFPSLLTLVFLTLPWHTSLSKSLWYSLAQSLQNSSS